MTTIIAVRIGDGKTKPKLQKVSGGWEVVGEVEQCVKYGRGAWVRTYELAGGLPKDGKGFLIGPTRRLTVG